VTNPMSLSADDVDASKWISTMHEASRSASVGGGARGADMGTHVAGVPTDYRRAKESYEAVQENRGMYRLHIYIYRYGTG
jgi:hypothetical protein